MISNFCALKKDWKGSDICSCCNPVKTPTNHCFVFCLETPNQMPPSPCWTPPCTSRHSESVAAARDTLLQVHSSMEEKMQRWPLPRWLNTSCYSALKPLWGCRARALGGGFFGRTCEGGGRGSDGGLRPCCFHILGAFQNYQPQL